MNKDKKEILIEYRKKHHNCYYCIWYHFFSKYMCEFFYDECILKDKIIHFPKLKATFCKWYQVKEEEENE